MSMRPILALCVVLPIVAACESARPESVGAGGARLVGLAAPDVESTPGGNGQVVLSWSAVPGADHYDIYRATMSGREAYLATTTDTSYTDSGLTSSFGVASSDFVPSPVYYYTVAAADSVGDVSAQSAETASATPLPQSAGNGQVAGVPSGDGSVYYFKDALLSGFDYFTVIPGWFPQILNTVAIDGTSNANTPNKYVVDAAYAKDGAIQFSNVLVPTSGQYVLDFRYAFATGLFPGVTDRAMGLRVNGTVITSAMSFPVTGDFEAYADSTIRVSLNAGQNTVVLFAVSDHAVARLDTMTVTAAITPSVTLVLSGDPSSGSYAVEAQTNASGVDRVDFTVDGALYHTEHIYKYCLFGGDASCNPGMLGKGQHQIIATVSSSSSTIVSSPLIVQE
jgi:hypothetical protein